MINQKNINYQSVYKKSNTRIFIILAVVLIFLSLPSVISQDVTTRFYGKINTNLTITEPCSVDGFRCGSDFKCNITITDSSQNIIINEQSMNKNSSLYLYYLAPTKNTKIGTYENDVYCYNSTMSGQDTFYFQITNTGKPPVSDFTFVLFTILLIIVIGGYFFYAIYNIMFLINLKWKDGKPQDIFGIKDILFNFVGYLVLYFFYYLYNFYVADPMIIRIISIMLYASVLVNLFLGVICFMISLVYFGLNTILKSLKN